MSFSNAMTSSLGASVIVLLCLAGVCTPARAQGGGNFPPQNVAVPTETVTRDTDQRARPANQPRGGHTIRF